MQIYIIHEISLFYSIIIKPTLKVAKIEGIAYISYVAPNYILETGPNQSCFVLRRSNVLRPASSKSTAWSWPNGSCRTFWKQNDENSFRRSVEERQVRGPRDHPLLKRGRLQGIDIIVYRPHFFVLS